MKLKFEKEVQDIIDAIALLPNTAHTDEAIWRPNAIIGELDKKLTSQKNDKSVSAKQWTKVRRQLSFLYEIIRLASEAGKPPGAGFPQAQLNAKKVSYSYIVKAMGDIVSGNALTEPAFVRLALNYGVVYLSDHEIAKLIENNRN